VSLTTQYVAGGADESDREILGSAAQLYDELRLARIYYSAFSPVSDTPLENHAPTPPWREHRLYQADHLLRFYGFGVDEIVYGVEGNLPKRADPKLLWAQAHPEWFPLELNAVEERLLLRVPGIGPRGAHVILRRRKQGTLRDLSDLGLSRSCLGRIAPYVLLDGRAPARQLSFW
jgi:predicted DNA-binding helix-hairpin-helix protein